MSESASEASEPFSGRVVAALLAVGVAAFAGFVALSAYAPELADGTDGGAHALSRSAVGYAGLAKLLRLAGQPVVVSRGVLHNQAEGLTIATPPASISASDAREFWETPRTLLVVLPKWRAVNDPAHIGWVQKAGLVDSIDPVDVAVAFTRAARNPDEPEKPPSMPRPGDPRPKPKPPIRAERRAGVSRPVLRAASDAFSDMPPQKLDGIDSFQTLSPPEGGEVLIADETGKAVLFRVDKTTYVLTEPDLMNNLGLKSKAAAEFDLNLLAKLRNGRGPVILDVTLNGFSRSRSMLRLALGPPFLGASLIALMAGLLMGGHALVRFGPVLRPTRAYDRGKRGLVENSAALIALAGRRAAMGGRYADLVRRAVAKTGLRGMGPDRIDEALDRLTPQDQPSFTTLAAQAAMAPGDAEALEAARRLHRWRLEITRERI